MTLPLLRSPKGFAILPEATSRVCRVCGVEKALSDFRPSKPSALGYERRCRACCNVAARKRYQENPGRFRDANTRWLMRNSDRYREMKRLSRQKHRDARCAAEKAYRDRMRFEALVAYGGNPPRCSCCSESTYEFLSIDHIKGGGRQERQRVGGSTTSLLSRLRREGYPPGYGVLCHNCNLAKGFYGLCPHQRASGAQKAS